MLSYEPVNVRSGSKADGAGAGVRCLFSRGKRTYGLTADLFLALLRRISDVRLKCCGNKVLSEPNTCQGKLVATAIAA